MTKGFLHIILATAVFLSSAGVMVSNHFCQNEFLNASLYFSLENCYGHPEENPCAEDQKTCSDDGHQKEKKNCCEHKKEFFKLDQDQQIEQIEFQPFESLVALNAVIPTTSELSVLYKRAFQYQNYSSPLIVFDRQVRLQTFLC